MNGKPPKRQDNWGASTGGASWRLLASLLLGLALFGGVLFAWRSQAGDGGPAAGLPEAIVYKSPTCGCCSDWAAHLEENGFAVTLREVEDMEAVKQRLGVPLNLASCHTAQVGDYVVEGHVPAADVIRLLEERPAVRGLAAPGMPMGSPGMEVPGEPADRYTVFSFSEEGRTELFARH